MLNIYYTHAVKNKSNAFLLVVTFLQPEGTTHGNFCPVKSCKSAMTISHLPVIESGRYKTNG